MNKEEHELHESTNITNKEKIIYKDLSKSNSWNSSIREIRVLNIFGKTKLLLETDTSKLG